MATVISVSNCLDLPVLSRYQLETIYPTLVGKLMVKESSTGFGYVLMFAGSPEEWESITCRWIKYDLSHLA